jgi:Fe/S biogenesis protein NfuA
MSEATTHPDTTVFTVAPKARKRVLELRADEEEPEGLALWVEIIGSRGTEFAYDLYFQGAEHADSGDIVIDEDGLTVVIPADSAEEMRGAHLDMNRDLLNPGMVITNPNRPATASPSVDAGPPPELEGTTEEKVVQLLEQHINPSIAAHGGRADLDRVEDGVAYLRLSGGCQGCGMAAVTLRQGIEVAVMEAIPEITEIVDVTDHAAGANPYY